MQQVLVIPYRRFGTTYRSHLRGLRIQEIHLFKEYTKLQNFLATRPVGATLIKGDRQIDMTVLISSFLRLSENTLKYKIK